MYKEFYQRFLEASGNCLRFTAHSHHYWPDVTREAVLRYWDDSARMVDGKWGELFEKQVGVACANVAEILQLNSAEDVVFASNTHAILSSLLSCLPVEKKWRVLTTDGEFHSFSRQMRRLREDDLVELEVISVAPIETFEERFYTAVSRGGHDLVFLSQVFFNSGYAVAGLEHLVGAVADDDTMVVIDGYHGFCAVPTDLSRVCRRAFYLAGGYKYAQAGEGACFLCVPPNCEMRPRQTGWFADFAGLENNDPDAPVGYSRGAMRFAGATFDPSGIYRFNSVMQLWQEHGITVSTVHEWVRALQHRFMDGLELLGHPVLNRRSLLYDPERVHGHFLTFEIESADQAAALARALDEVDVHTDYRANRLRFGFGMQHDETDIDDCLQRVAALTKSNG